VSAPVVRPIGAPDSQCFAADAFVREGRACVSRRRGEAQLPAGHVFLASDDARWITGDTVRVDGGLKL
jgi:NAD(P)-dependent dehydrogenase (short-subunit alcohol dehydrogenase family)